AEKLLQRFNALITTSQDQFVFFLLCYVDLRDLHSFPTRRSSDLSTGAEFTSFTVIVIAAVPLRGGEPLSVARIVTGKDPGDHDRSEEHTSELQSRSDLVCRLLLEKKK